MSSSTIPEKTAQYVLNTYTRPPFVLVSGQGMTVTDSDGKQYLDFGSGISVNALGHSDPEIVAVIQEQIAQLSHVCNLYHTAPHADLAELLCNLSFADKVYFANSGGEAVEAAIKFARKYARTTYGPGKTGIVAFSGGFHGRTAGALALTAREKYQAPFRPLMPDVSFAPFNDIVAAEKLIGPQTCAVFVEPVQGEGGIHVATVDFLQAVRAACDRFGALLVFDVWHGAHGEAVGLRAYRRAAGHYAGGEGVGRRAAHRRDAAHRPCGRSHAARRSRQHLRGGAGGVPDSPSRAPAGERFGDAGAYRGNG
jgi:acetylornithine/N-succinyldiaminopimelate aminotransferase